MDKDKKVQNNEGVLTPHEIKIESSRLVKKCEAAGIPIFLAYFVPPDNSKGEKKGKYEYAGVFPIEIGTPEVLTEVKRFDRFLETCMNFKKDDYYISITNKES